MVEIINNKIDVEQLSRLVKSEDYNENNIDKNLFILEQMLISKEIVTLLWFDSRNEIDWQELNTDFVPFFKDFFNNKITINNFKILKEFNGKTWNELERRFQRKIESAYITCNIIRRGTSNEDVEVFKQNI